MAFNMFDIVIAKLCNSSTAVFFKGKVLNIASKMHFLYRCHFSRIPQIGLMFVAKFS